MSIFSINDNSNYGSILSQSKANKESKENSKISFANAFLKQNASKLSDIESKNSQTLARSEILSNNNALSNNSNSTNISNSSNTNLSINNATKTSSPNYDISSEFKNSIYTLKYKQVDLSTDTAYGYSVEKMVIWEVILIKLRDFLKILRYINLLWMRYIVSIQVLKNTLQTI